MKLVTKHGREIEIDPEFRIQSDNLYIKGNLSTAYMDRDELCIFLEGANNLLEDQDRIKLDITSKPDLFTNADEAAIVWEDVSVKLDVDLAKMLYYSVYDPENEFLKNLRDYGVRNAN